MTYRIGRADIRQCDLITNDGTEVDISNIIHVLSYYEDIFAPSISCNISVIDGVALASTYNLTGGEILKLNFGERDEREIEVDLILNTMSERLREGPDYEYYTLNFITEHNIRDFTQIVQRAYSKEIHKIIEDVISEYFPEKPLVEVEETDGIHNIIGTGVSPFSFIKQCVNEAQSLDNPGSSYVFFETLDGYHFVTLEKLYSKAPTHQFVYDEITESAHTKASKLTNNIRHLKPIVPIDLQGKQVNGQFHSVGQSFDPLTKAFVTQTTKFSTNTLPSETMEKYFGNPTTKVFTTTTSHRVNSQYFKDREPGSENKFRRRDKFNLQKRSMMHKFDSIKLHISIPGNSSVQVGETANIIIPRAAETLEEKTLNEPQLAGKYLITAVSHRCAVAPQNDFVTVLELMKPSFEEGY